MHDGQRPFYAYTPAEFARKCAIDGCVYDLITTCRNELEREPTDEEWALVLERFVREGSFFPFLEALRLREKPLSLEDIAKYRGLYHEIHF